MFEHLTADEWLAIDLSLKVGLWSVIVSLPIGFGLAFILARHKFPLKDLLNSLVYMPLILPPVVTGYILLLLFGKHGPIGIWLKDWFGVTVAFRWTGAVIAAAIMGLPLMVRAMRLSIEQVDARLEQASRSLGASPLWTFATITVPLSMPGVIAGTILSFAKSFGEFGATITFVSNIPGETQTLPIAIYSLLQTPGGEMAAARLAILSVIVSMLAVTGSERATNWLHKRMNG